MKRLRDLGGKVWPWAVVLVALPMLALMLIPGEVWNRPTNDAVYTGFDPNLMYITPQGAGSSEGVADVSPESLTLTALPNSQPTAHLVTTPLSFNAAMDVRVLETGVMRAGTTPFRISIWNPQTRSGHFLDFGPAPGNFVTAQTVVEGGVAHTLIGGDVEEVTVTLDPATFTDAGSDVHTATIDWGDGSRGEDVDSSDITEPDGGPGTVAGSHVYSDQGVFTVTVSVTDNHFNQAGDTFVVTVVLYKCGGLERTHLGTEGAEIISGTPGDDVIVGRGGDDVILGFGGNDTICGGPGADIIDGGPGRDRLFGQAGDDIIRGGGGPDRLVGGGGDDFLRGGPGKDKLFGNRGHDVLDGGSDNDRLVGGANDDVILGRAGNDTISCGPGFDFANGGPGTDTQNGTCEAGKIEPADMPDLVVALDPTAKPRVECDPNDGCSIHDISFEATNIGNADSGPFKVRLEFSGGAVSTHDMGRGLAPGESQALGIGFGPANDCYVLINGGKACTVTATVDSDDEVEESDEANNVDMVTYPEV